MLKLLTIDKIDYEFSGNKLKYCDRYVDMTIGYRYKTIYIFMKHV